MSRSLPPCESCHKSATAWWYVVPTDDQSGNEPIVHPSSLCRPCSDKIKGAVNAVIYPVYSIPEDAVHFHPVIYDTITCLKYGDTCDLMFFGDDSDDEDATFLSEEEENQADIDKFVDSLLE